MKTLKIKNGLPKVQVLFCALLLIFPVLNACHYKSNMEDDTFKESIIDDPERANRKAAEKKTC